MTRRDEARRMRADTRSSLLERRERTRRLIELGGLVQKAGLVELTGDDRPALLGAFLGLADILAGPERDAWLAQWRRRGKRAFEADQAARAGAKDGSL